MAQTLACASGAKLTALPVAGIAAGAGDAIFYPLLLIAEQGIT